MSFKFPAPDALRAALSQLSEADKREIRASYELDVLRYAIHDASRLNGQLSYNRLFMLTPDNGLSRPHILG